MGVFSGESDVVLRTVRISDFMRNFRHWKVQSDSDYKTYKYTV